MELQLPWSVRTDQSGRSVQVVLLRTHVKSRSKSKCHNHLEFEHVLHGAKEFQLKANC